MKPVWAKRRVDSTAKELTAYARSLGLDVEPLGGTVDCAMWYSRVVRLVDFKTPGKEKLTEAQGKLIARGCPVCWISTPGQLDTLAAEMKAEATR